MNSRSDTPILELIEVSLNFGGIKALQGVVISVTKERIDSVIGPNGAGKSTLLNCISGLYRPKGKICFGEHDLISRRAHERPSLGIARTFQNIALFRGGARGQGKNTLEITSGEAVVSLDGVKGATIFGLRKRNEPMLHLGKGKGGRKIKRYGFIPLPPIPLP